MSGSNSLKQESRPAVPELDTLDTAIVRLDAERNVVGLNPAAEICLGASRERLIGKDFKSIHGIPGELLGALANHPQRETVRHLQELQMVGGSYDCSVHHVDGNALVLELHDLRWEQQRKKLHRSALHAGLMDLFSQNLAHEIRNPLGGIRGAAQFLTRQLENDARSAELATLARLIMRESDRIEELIRKFGQQAIEAEPFDFYPLLDEAMDLLRAEFGQDFAVVRDFDPSLPELHGDAAAIRMVLVNLLRNACQAGAESIVIRTRVVHDPGLLQSSGPALQIEVVDDGSGVPEKLRPLLFLPLVTGRRDGTGLGLALSQQLAAAHGGMLNFEPVREGGSMFSLILPLRHQPGERLRQEAGT